MDQQPTIGVTRRTVRLALAFAVVLAVLAPVAVIAAGGTFTDDEDSIFEANIEWMAANGITAGCNPPANDHYCPDDSVTRGQMAAFMQRLATNKVVDAATAVEADHAADTAELGGLTPGYYNNPVHGITCTASTCGAGAGFELINVVDLSVEAPHGGYFTIAASYNGSQPGTSDLIQSWVAVDEATDCGGWFFGPLDAVPGTFGWLPLDGSITMASISSTVVIPVTAGTHSVHLCTLGADTVTSNQGALTVTFSSVGSSSALSGAPTEAYTGLLAELLGDVEAID